MQFSQDKPTHAFVFHRIDADGILLNDTLYTHSLFITAQPRLFDWSVASMADLTPILLTPLLEGAPDLVLLGTGPTPIALPATLLGLCWEKRIGIETMTTPAAARTYNLLANEGRRVALGLIL